MPKVAMTNEVFDDIKPINGDILDGNAASTTTTTAAATTAAKRTISFATTKPAAESQTVKKDRMHPSMSENNILAVGSQTNLESNVKSTVKSVVVSPEDYLIYNRASDSDDASALITLQNKSPTPVAFKIKSTNPDAYRVKPVSGIVSPMSNAEIVVTLLAGKQMNTSNDRFQLVLVMVRDKSSIDNLSTFWKNIPTNPDDFADHRLQLQLAVGDTNKSARSYASGAVAT
ncbi:hypothetical protein HELRODRAFT_176820 [Helobdella robusta]|uniref:MSP domain-containing protein n=1 Tax=Helobdella robusta TaxID=6412 RepID=T1FAY0_HELRO|nr:hypothetical protein HELRODRAFT_176820 [Helobdella robusta]ESN99649.1 hypothetical protein HELRODRAFT_176820 [Helobdella robusta]